MFLLRINRMCVSNRDTTFLFPCCVFKQRCSRGVSSFLGCLKRQKAVCSAAPLPETSEGADTLESRDHKSAHTDEQRRRRGSRLCPSAVWNVFFSLFSLFQGRLTLVLSEGKILAQCSVGKIKAFYNYTFFFFPLRRCLYSTLHCVM